MRDVWSSILQPLVDERCERRRRYEGLLADGFVLDREIEVLLDLDDELERVNGIQSQSFAEQVIVVSDVARLQVGEVQASNDQFLDLFDVRGGDGHGSGRWWA